VLVQSPALPGAASTNTGSIEPPQNNLAVYGTAPRGADLIITNTPIDFTLRPAPLQNVRDAYALLVISDTMSPVFEPGDTLLINPHLPPLRGNDVLLRKDEKDNEPTVIILGHLTGTTERAYTIREYNGPKGKVRERQIDRKDFPNCHRIVGKFSR
jgi:phage repressor protein C with HTH and peptisase S24 domain